MRKKNKKRKISNAPKSSVPWAHSLQWKTTYKHNLCCGGYRRANAAVGLEQAVGLEWMISLCMPN